jgi:hypothetical protein
MLPQAVEETAEQLPLQDSKSHEGLSADQLEEEIALLESGTSHVSTDRSTTYKHEVWVFTSEASLAARTSCYTYADSVF